GDVDGDPDQGPAGPQPGLAVRAGGGVPVRHHGAVRGEVALLRRRRVPAAVHDGADLCRRSHQGRGRLRRPPQGREGVGLGAGPGEPLRHGAGGGWGARGRAGGGLLRQGRLGGGAQEGLRGARADRRAGGGRVPAPRGDLLRHHGRHPLQGRPPAAGMTLEPPRAQQEAWLAALSRFVLDHLEGLEQALAAGPIGAAGAAIADEVSRPIGEAPLPGGIDEIVRLLDRAASASLTAPGPGYLAYIPGGGLFGAALADFVADALNRYTGLSAPAPALFRLEEDVLSWLCRA